MIIPYTQIGLPLRVVGEKVDFRAARNEAGISKGWPDNAFASPTHPLVSIRMIWSSKTGHDSHAKCFSI